MRIDKNHLFHGAALLQVAEHPLFTSINKTEYRRCRSGCAFTINNSIGLYLKYAAKPVGSCDEYKFTFKAQNLAELSVLASIHEQVFIGLVCVEGAHICCITKDQLDVLRATRRAAAGGDEEQYQLLVTLHPVRAFNVYVREPGKRGTSLGRLVVRRNQFPRMLFRRLASVPTLKKRCT